MQVFSMLFTDQNVISFQAKLLENSQAWLGASSSNIAGELFYLVMIVLICFLKVYTLYTYTKPSDWSNFIECLKFACGY